MNREAWLVGGLVLALVIVAALTRGGGRNREQSARIAAVVNKVEARPRAEEEWVPAAVWMTVHGGGQVRTHTGSAALLELLEGNVRLSADTVCTLKESATRGRRLVTTLHLASGRVWVDLTTSKRHLFTVETPSAVAVVRDTRFAVEVVGGRTQVSVAGGEVELTAQEQTVVVSAGQQAQVEPGEPPSMSNPGDPGLIPSAPRPVNPTRSPSVPRPVREDESRLSGEWVGTVTIHQRGGCGHPQAGEPLNLTLQWRVNDDGAVAITETDTRHWRGTVGTDLSVSLIKTFEATCGGERRTGTAQYEGLIRQENGSYRLDMSAVEDWCPPDCRFLVVYSIVKK